MNPSPTFARRRFTDHAPLPDELMSALDAADAAADGEPDGSWWASLEDTVRHYNQRTGHGYDPNDAVYKWVRTSGKYEIVPPLNQ